MSLSATWSRYEVEPVARTAAGPYSLGIHHVRHPTAREAICVVEHGEAAASGDADAWHLLRGALCSWLPLRLYSVLVSDRMSQENAVGIAMTLLSVGLSEPEKKNHEKRKAKRQIPWSELVARYRHAYPGGSLDEPWPFWIEQAMEIDKMMARDTLNAFTAHALGQTGNKETLADLKQRAGYEEEWDEEAALERQKRSLDHLKGIHHQMSKGKRFGRA